MRRTLPKSDLAESAKLNLSPLTQSRPVVKVLASTDHTFFPSTRKFHTPS